MARSEHIPVGIKLRTFAPQAAMVAVSTGAATGAAAVSSTVAIVPLVVMASVFGLLAIITTMAKAMVVEDKGWPEFDRPCVQCRRLEVTVRELEKDRAELRAAILVLEPPA